MSEVSLEEQIRCLEEMESCLENFCVKMQEYIDDLSKSIKLLRSDELTIEFEEFYDQNYYRHTKTIVDQVKGDIEYGHLRYLDEVIEKLKGLRD